MRVEVVFLEKRAGNGNGNGNQTTLEPLMVEVWNNGEWWPSHSTTVP